MPPPGAEPHAFMPPPPRDHRIEPDLLSDQARRGHDLHRAGLTEYAAAWYRRALAARDDDAAALAGLAHVALAGNQHDEAAALAERAVTVEPRHLPFHDLLLSCTRVDARTFVDGFERRARTFGDLPGHEAGAARAYLDLGQPVEALRLVRRVNPPSALVQEAERAAQAFNEAERFFQEAAAQAPEPPSLEALADLLRRSLKAYPLHASAALNLGLTLLAQQQGERAIAALQPLAERRLVRDRAVLLVNLGWAAVMAGLLPLALRSLDEAHDAFLATTGHEPHRHLAFLPCLTRWDDAEKRIETSPREPLQIIDRLLTACKATSLVVPAGVRGLVDLYQLCLARAEAEEESAPIRRALAEPQTSPAPDTESDADSVTERDATAEPVASWAAGTVLLEQFAITSRLGAGQRGPLHLAVHRGTGQAVLVERVAADTVQARRDLWDGLRVWCNLPAHDALLGCRLFSSLDDEALVFFEPPGGPTLDTVLQRFTEAPPSPEAAAFVTAFAIGLAWALDLAHASGVTHGPIALAHVHVTGESDFCLGGFWHGNVIGEEEAVRRHISALLVPDQNPLMRALHENSLRSHVPVPRGDDAPLGTDATERIDAGGATPGSDAWHWAVAVIEAATRAHGLPRSPDDTPLQHLDRLVESPHVGTMPAQMPAELIRILRRSLDPDPRLRPQRLADVAEAIHLVFGPHFRATPPPLVPAQHGVRALEHLTRAAPSDPSDAADDLPWKDPRLALAIAYRAAGLDPLAPRPFLPRQNATEQGRTLSHLAALELASSLVRSQIEASPDLVPELARQRFEASMMQASLGDLAGALRQSDEAVSLLDRALATEASPAGLRFFLAAVKCEQAIYREGTGQAAASIDILREADQILRATPITFETQALSANVSMRLAMVARRRTETSEIARDALERAARIWRDQENLENLGYTHAFLAQVHASRGEAALATASWERAVPLLESPHVPRDGPGGRLLGNGWLQRATHLVRANQWDDADTANQRALDALASRVEKEGQVELSPLLAAACMNAARIRAGRGQTPQALELLQRARLTLERRLAQEADLAVLRQIVDGLVLESQLLATLGEPQTGLLAVQRAKQWMQPLRRESDALEDVMRSLAVERLLAQAFANLDRDREAAAAMRLALGHCDDALTASPEAALLTAQVQLDAALLFRRLELPGEAAGVADRLLAAHREHTSLPLEAALEAELVATECRFMLGDAGQADVPLHLLEDARCSAGADLRSRIYGLHVARRMADGRHAQAEHEAARAAASLETWARQAAGGAVPSEQDRAICVARHVNHGRLALQIGEPRKAIDALARALDLNPSNGWAADLHESCRLLLEAVPTDAPILLARARASLTEAKQLVATTTGDDPTRLANHRSMLEAFRLSAEAFQLAKGARRFDAPPSLLARLTRRRATEAQQVLAEAAHLRLHTQLLMGWNGGARAWMRETLDAVSQASDAQPATFGALVGDVTAAMRALA